jgi:hypothetical protein
MPRSRSPSTTTDCSQAEGPGVVRAESREGQQGRRSPVHAERDARKDANHLQGAASVLEGVLDGDGSITVAVKLSARTTYRCEALDNAGNPLDLRMEMRAAHSSRVAT